MARTDGLPTIALVASVTGLWTAFGYGKQSPPYTKKTAALGELIRILNRYNQLSPPLFIVDGLPDDHYIDKCIHIGKIDETFIAWEEGYRWLARFTGYPLSGFGETQGEAIGDLILLDIMPTQNEATGDLLPFDIVQKPVEAAAEPERPAYEGKTEIIIERNPDDAREWVARYKDVMHSYSTAIGDTKAEALGHLLAIMTLKADFATLLGHIFAHLPDHGGPRMEFYDRTKQRSEDIHKRKVKAVIAKVEANLRQTPLTQDIPTVAWYVLNQLKSELLG